MLPAAPLVRQVELAVLAEGTASLIQRYSERFGIAPDSADRMLDRLRVRATVTPDLAEQVCIVLGLHPRNVYGDDWARAGGWHLNPREVAVLRRMRAAGASLPELGAEAGVSHSTVHAALQREVDRAAS